MNDFPPPNTPPQPAPGTSGAAGSSDELGNRLRSMVERTAPAVTADEAQFTTAVVTPLRAGGPSAVWKVAAVGLGAVAMAGSALSYAVGHTAGKRDADKRVAVVPGANAPAAAGSAKKSAPAGEGDVAAAPPPTMAVFPGAPVSARSAGAGFGSDGFVSPEDMFGPAPVKLFDRTVGAVTMHVYSQPINYGYAVAVGTNVEGYAPGSDTSVAVPVPIDEPYSGGGWYPPAQCRSTANVVAYIATSQFTGQAQGQEYPTPSVPVIGYGNPIGHPKVEFFTVIPVQVPAGAKTVRLLKADKTVMDEMAPDKGWAFLVNTDALAGFGSTEGPFGVVANVEVVLEDGSTAAGVMQGMPGSPQAAKECQPPPPPPPTITSDYTALTGKDLAAVTEALADTFGSVSDRATAPTHLENGDKFTKEWFAAIKERAVALNAGKIEIKMSSAGVKGDKAVAIFQLGGTAIESSWQVVELVKGKDGWLVTTPSFCRIAGMAYACPTDLYDPTKDQGPPPVDYGSGYGGGGEWGPVPLPASAVTTAAPPVRTSAIPAPPQAPTVAPSTTAQK
jgi:hypothetical protein